MSISVKLNNIIEGMEFQTEESCSYVNKKTGEVVWITDEEIEAVEGDDPIENFPAWQHESIKTARKILETDDYISLPSKFDIHEYNIMERFCLSIEDDEVRDIMYRSIKGSGAFRRFKDNIHRYNIAEDWYKFREEAFKEIAIDWCKKNDIVYKND